MSQSQIYPHDLTGRTIRLLSIEPGKIDAPVRCTLEETCLDGTPTPYYALSYCWGLNHSPVEITCNSDPLLITPSLHSALLEYRRRGVNVPLWVDAVCINQSNVAERTSQVRMMQTIYSNAARVVVWLGEAETTDELALEVLKAINGPWAMYRDSYGREIPLWTGHNTANHDARLAAQIPDAAFDALAAFLLKPWFSRIWIVQELICASELSIWCGPQTLNEDFPVLEAAARLYTMTNCTTKTSLGTTVLKDKKTEGTGRSKMMCAGRLWSFKIAKENGMSGILWFLLITRCFDATDPRDKIFALVGLVSNVSEEFIDYSKSYDTVVREFSHMLLDGRIETTSGSIFDLWSCITKDEHDDLSGPSWAVDWLKLRDSGYTPLMSQYQSDHLTIHRKPEIHFSEADKGEELHVRGIVFDTVTHIVPSPIVMRQLVPQSEFLTFKHVPSYNKWHTDAIITVATTNASPDNIYQATGQSLYDAFWRTLCCNRSTTDVTEVPIDDSGYVAWRRLVDLQQECYDADITCRRVCQRHKRLVCGFTSVVVSALTYIFRRQKLLFVIVPFSLPPLIQLISKTYDTAQNILLSAVCQKYLQQSAQVQIDQRDFDATMSQWNKGRQFIVTASGLMGWAPLAASKGDNVGLFAGCRVPFVMRAFQEGYKIVGDAYVHGLMDGEGEASDGEMLKIL